MFENSQSVFSNDRFQTWDQASSDLENVLFKPQKLLSFSDVVLGTRNRPHSRAFLCVVTLLVRRIAEAESPCPDFLPLTHLQDIISGSPASPSSSLAALGTVRKKRQLPE